MPQSLLPKRFGIVVIFSAFAAKGLQSLVSLSLCKEDE
jgi:hypothetical protein